MRQWMLVLIPGIIYAAGCDDSAPTAPVLMENTRIAVVMQNSYNYTGTDVYTMKPDGTDLRRITNRSSNENAPDWSPDGSMIVYASEIDQESQIYVINADGSNERQLTFDGYYSSPRWSPDGTSIVFVKLSSIWIMNIDGTNQRKLTNSSAEEYYPDFSPDGSMIAFVAWSPTKDLYVVRIDGTENANITNNGNAVYEHYPVWSPDGEKILYTASGYSKDSGSWRDLYVIKIDGSGNTRLTNHKYGNQYGSWSPDGAQIAYNGARTDWGLFNKLFIMDIDKAAETEITAFDKQMYLDAVPQMPDWSPWLP